MTFNRFPPAALEPQAAIRERLENCELTLLYRRDEAARSEPLHGFYFTVTPAGTVEKRDASPPATFLAGDGVVVRLTLEPGRIVAAHQVVRDPTSVAHTLTTCDRSRWAEVPPYRAYGVAIMSLDLLATGSRGLGSRVLANTALVPYHIDGYPVLLVTTDGSRPIVFDPVSMRSIGALGSSSEWKGALLNDTEFPFVATTAHPAYDSRTHELFSVNFARDLFGEKQAPTETMSWQEFELRRATGTLPLPKEHIPEWAFARIERSAPGLLAGSFDNPALASSYYSRLADTEYFVVDKALLINLATADAEVAVPTGEVEVLALPGALVRALRSPTTEGGTVLERFLDAVLAVYRDAASCFTHLLCFSSKRKGELQLCRWPLEDNDGPVAIIDSVHQMAVTDEWVILADTQFKFAVTLVLSNVLDSAPRPIARTLRRYLSRPQQEGCHLYFVSRADLATTPSGKAVHARKVTLDAEVVHFIADWADEGGERVRVTAVHQRAMDGAEFLTTSDLDADNRPVNPEVVGMFPMSLDLNEVAQYVIDPIANDGAKVQPAHRVADRDHTWAIGIGAGPGIGCWEDAWHVPYDRHDWTAWYNEGFLPELITRHTYALYRGYRGRTNESKGRALVSLDELRGEIRKGGTSGSYFRVDHPDEGLRITDGISLGFGVQLMSPQYVPPREDSHPGFVVGIVFRANTRGLANDERSREVWVFRADELSEPILRFDASPLGFQYTLHTAWIGSFPESIAPPDFGAIAFERDGKGNSPRNPIERLLAEVYAILGDGFD